MPISCLQGMLTIETFFDGQSKPNLILEQDIIKHLNVQISTELQNIVPHLDDSTYAIVGGLFQSSEILQPGFPIHTQLRQYANAALKGENNRRNQLIIGTNDSNLPKGLRRNKNVHMTPLLLMPFVIITENKDTKDVFETQLMHKGMGSVDLLKQLQNALGVKIRHVNFMTVLDLAAMMHNHLQMAGFDPLWNVLEQALFNENPETKAITKQHNEFYLSKKIVFTPFFSFLVWSNYGPGKELENKQEAYLHYTQVQRQHVATLKEHGLDVRQFIPTPEIWPTNADHICFATLDKSRISGNVYHEVINPLSQNLKVNIDKNDHPNLGIVFFQISDENDGLEYFYPLTDAGIKEIEAIINKY